MRPPLISRSIWVPGARLISRPYPRFLPVNSGRSLKGPSKWGNPKTWNRGGDTMLYIAFAKSKSGTVIGNTDIMAKSRKWWNEGDRPAGLKTVGFYGALGTNTPDVYIFEADSHEDIRKMIDYWKEVEFDIHPALDFADMYRKQ